MLRRYAFLFEETDIKNIWRRIKSNEKQRKYVGEVWDAEADLDDIYHCFRLILGRPPSRKEWDGHSSMSGQDLTNVVNTYLTSAEFRNRKLDYLDLSDIHEVELEGRKMCVPGNDPHIGSRILATGRYEEHITQYIRQALRPGNTFVDIGANIGFFTTLGAHLVGTEGSVIAIEPSDNNVKFILRNKQINDFPQIKIHPLAAADKEDLWLYDSAASNGFIFSVDDDLQRLFGSTLVYSKRLDDLLMGHSVDLIKVDVEGAEYIALLGARECLRQHRPTIIAEFSSAALLSVSKITPDPFFDLLIDELDYQVAVFEGLNLVDCGKDRGKVLEVYNKAASDHIDILLTPAS